MSWLILLGSLAWAYIPDFHMILSRAAENHGRGLYQIEQDVVFRGDPDPLVVKETWLIAGETAMRVTFEGKGSLQGLIQGTLVFDGTHKYWLDDSGAQKSARLGDEWIEPFFHFRFSKNIKPRLVALKIAPSESLRDRTPSVKDNEWKYPAQNFMRLSRSGGTVSYAIGAPTLPDAAEGQPGLWIEQDQFVLRKLRLPTQTLITTDQYSRYPEGLWLPKLRQIYWGQQSAQIHLSTVKSLGKQSKSAELLRSSSLDPKKATQLRVKWPDLDQIRDFYSRFR